MGCFVSTILPKAFRLNCWLKFLFRHHPDIITFALQWHTHPHTFTCLLVLWIMWTREKSQQEALKDCFPPTRKPWPNISHFKVFCRQEASTWPPRRPRSRANKCPNWKRGRDCWGGGGRERWRGEATFWLSQRAALWSFRQVFFLASICREAFNILSWKY